MLQVEPQVAKTPSPAYPKGIKTLGDHIRKKRLDLGLFQKDVAKQIRVNKDTIHIWETNRTEPELRLIPHIIDFLGDVPYDPTWSSGPRLKAVRSALRLSQEKFAKKIRVDESTIAEWEREEQKPTKKKWVLVSTSIRSHKL